MKTTIRASTPERQKMYARLKAKLALKHLTLTEWFWERVEEELKSK